MYKSVFIIGTVWVEPNSSAAGTRMLQLIEYFQSQGYRIVFGTTAQKNENSLELDVLGIQEVTLKLNDASFDELLQELDPDIVLFDRFLTEEQFGWRVAENAPNALRILDTEDLHCLRKVRAKQYEAGKPFLVSDLLTEDITKREIASIFRVDLSLMISSYEMEVLQKVFQIDGRLLCYLPFLIPKANQKTQGPGFEKRQHFISIGNFLHPPNLAAVITLKHKIWPMIRKAIPEAEIHIYGAYLNQQVKEFRSKEQAFYVHGFVENKNEVLQRARVLLAPLAFGAGLKGKFIDGMQNGCPSVTSTIGIEGYSNAKDWAGLVADNHEDFIQKAIDLYDDESLWNQSNRNAEQILRKFDKNKHTKKLTNKLEELTNNLEGHRKKNFIGSLLMHHTMTSTKYLSKWIEAKNRF